MYCFKYLKSEMTTSILILEVGQQVPQLNILTAYSQAYSVVHFFPESQPLKILIFNTRNKRVK